jgi:transcriptional regulator with XRE-family HTH domain
MSGESQTEVGRVLRERREEKGLSVRGLAAAAKVDSTWLSRVEHGIYVNPDPRYLHRLAKALGMETISLFAIADYGEGLPPFAPYLREKYDLPAGAIDQLQAHFALLAERHKGERGDANVDHDPTTSRRHTLPPPDGR